MLAPGFLSYGSPPIMEDLLSLRNRTALVVGAASAIGSATAEVLAQAGARVALVDRAADAVAAMAARIEAAGGGALSIPGDPADPLLAARAVAQVVEAWDGLHILLIASLDHNGATRSALAWVRAAATPMRAEGFGRILCLCSIAARHGLSGAADQAAAGGALIALCRTWARELGPCGITSNAVAPGLIADDPACPVPLAVLPRIPAGRAGTAGEVANVFLYLASDLASFVNGAVVGVDGGLLL